MASKIYTAQEMLEAANAVDDVSINDNGEYYYEKDDKFNPDIVRDMLRQAADAMEHEAMREKKYEYSIRFRENQKDYDRDYIFVSKEYARTVAGDSLQVVRREVGEWEEVKDA